MSMPARLVEIRNLSVDFEGRRQFTRALHGIDLTLDRGEALGIVGESGCGKSITWMATLGLLGKNARVAGSARLDGEEILGADEERLNRLRGGRVAMIFQDPSSSLNPLHKIGWQLTEALRLHQNLHGEAARKEAERLIDRVGIANARQRFREYPHEFSGGMNQRVMIAMALAGNPDLLVADEPTTALDATIQAQILDLLDDLRRERGMALVLISHDLAMVSEMTERVVVMYCGRIVEDSPTADLFDNPQHPYTRGLIAALPSLDERRQRLTAIPGTVPPPSNLPPGCTFPELAAADRKSRVAEVMADVGLLGHHGTRYPHELSGGQRQRVIIARALALEPELLVCDEPVSALDVSVQAQVLNVFQDIRDKTGFTGVFISHDLKVVRQIADRVAVMYLGAIVEMGKPEDVFLEPAHPYTKALVSAVPRPGRLSRSRIVLSGDPPSPTNVPSGCPFHTRCAEAKSVCRSLKPELLATGDRTVACHLVNNPSFAGGEAA
ncbi:MULTISPECIES: dipeptide ABC transporter ATP-binding protein [unclassified Sinorhizobium]|uniref:dipeptide ABC transporter ATP-binding protein n=1 Tax=unclassified Sinorhizobium TaxID=2613772 RepID=UPI0035254A08